MRQYANKKSLRRRPCFSQNRKIDQGRDSHKCAAMSLRRKRERCQNGDAIIIPIVSSHRHADGARIKIATEREKPPVTGKNHQHARPRFAAPNRYFLLGFYLFLVFSPNLPRKWIYIANDGNHKRVS